MMTIGVLSVQGAFIEHIKMLEKLGVSCLEIRNKSDLARSYQGIILPGGESTVMGKLLEELDMIDTLRNRILEGMPVMGTCAGLILTAKRIANESKVHLGTMDITVFRNAYGRQLGSFHTISEFKDCDKIPMTFIRAPYIRSIGEGVKVLAKVDGHIVAAQQGGQIVTSFHPELTDDPTVHRYFLSYI